LREQLSLKAVRRRPGVLQHALEIARRVVAEAAADPPDARNPERTLMHETGVSAVRARPP
jgi:hypothetical protein